MTDDIEQLLAFGRIGLETGYYEQAHGYFEQVLALDPSNREAMKGLARVNEILSRRAAVEPTKPEVPVAKPAKAEARTKPPLAKRVSLKVDSSERIAERKRLAAKKREEQVREIARPKEEEVLMTAKGFRGVLELLEDRIRIRSEGIFLRKFGSTSEILLKDITAIQFKKAGWIESGSIEFSHLGVRWGLSASWSDYGVTFSRKQQPDFERIKAEIEKRIQTGRVPLAVSSGVDDIAKLADLRDRGILTEEEFQQKKKQILGL